MSRVRPLPIMETIDGLVITAVSTAVVLTEDSTTLVNSDIMTNLAGLSIMTLSLAAEASANLDPAALSETEALAADALSLETPLVESLLVRNLSNPDADSKQN